LFSSEEISTIEIWEEPLTRFIPGNAHVEGLSILEAYWGPGKLNGDQTKAKEHEDLPRFNPLER
jgi:hypothetical protein